MVLRSDRVGALRCAGCPCFELIPPSEWEISCDPRWLIRMQVQLSWLMQLIVYVRVMYRGFSMYMYRVAFTFPATPTWVTRRVKRTHLTLTMYSQGMLSEVSGSYDMTSRLTHSTTQSTVNHTFLTMSSLQTAGEPSRQRGSFSVQKTDDPRRVKILVCGWRKWVHRSRDKGVSWRIEPGRRVVSRLYSKIIQSRIHPTLELLKRLRRLITSMLPALYSSTSWWSDLYYPFNSGIHRTTSTWISLTFHYLLSLPSSMSWICRWARHWLCPSEAQLICQQDDSYHEAIERCVMLFLRIYLANRHVKMSIFIHKSEVLSEDYRGGKIILPAWLWSELMIRKLRRDPTKHIRLSCGLRFQSFPITRSRCQFQ